MSLKLNSSDLPLGVTRTGSDTVADGQLQTLLGTEGVFENRNWGATGIKTHIDRREIVCRLVRNEGGAARLPRRQVSYDTGTDQWGKEISAYTGDGEAGAGVIDPFITSSGLADNGIGWIIIRGPVDMENTADGVIAVGDRIVSAANGQVNEQTAAPADETAVMLQVGSYVGRAEEAAAATLGTVFRVDYRGEN